jgi:hypothetical protein
MVMGVRENRVEKYLDQCVRAIDGLTRKWVSPGVDGVPDRIVVVGGVVWMVEVKTSDGVLSDCQKREHIRLKDAGANVMTVYGHAGVDEFIARVMM